MLLGKRLGLVAAALWALVGWAAEKNIVVVIADDLSPTMGCYGDMTAVTPNIDRLAADGALFRYAFATTATTPPPLSYHHSPRPLDTATKHAATAPSARKVRIQPLILVTVAAVATAADAAIAAATSTKIANHITTTHPSTTTTHPLKMQAM